MSALIQPSDADIEEAEKILSEGKDPSIDMKTEGCFYVDVSGRYSVYYTFWRWNPRTATSHYISNLSTDFMTAIKKAAKASGRIPVIIDRFGTYAGLFKASKAEIITFGKYRGMTYGDIFVEDPQYLMWLATKYEGNANLDYEKLNYYKQLYFETLTKKNQEESKSQYVGKIGEKISIQADVYDFKVESNEWGLQYSCKLIDKDGNKYRAFNIGKVVKKGDTVKMTAKVKDHKEFLGVKFTIIYFCKITDVYNVYDDAEKYNL
jgi:hypothetical protein